MKNYLEFSRKAQELENSDTLYYALESTLGSNVALETTENDWNKLTDDLKEIACDIIMNNQISVYDLIRFIESSQELPF